MWTPEYLTIPEHAVKMIQADITAEKDAVEQYQMHIKMIQDESVSYCNTGSCVHPRCVTCIEIEHLRILLVKWTLATRPDRTLYVTREVLSGPFTLDL